MPDDGFVGISFEQATGPVVLVLAPTWIVRREGGVIVPNRSSYRTLLPLARPSSLREGEGPVWITPLIIHAGPYRGSRNPQLHAHLQPIR